MHWSELYAKLREHVVPPNCVANCIGYQWSNASPTNSPFWLRPTRRGRAEVRHIWHLSLVTMCHLVHWDRRTNCCLAVLTRPSSWLTAHFLFVRQRSGMTCLLTVVRQLLSIVLKNAILNANSFTPHVRWSLPVTVASRASDSVFFAWTYRRVTNWFWLIDWSSGGWRQATGCGQCLEFSSVLVGWASGLYHLSPRVFFWKKYRKKTEESYPQNTDFHPHCSLLLHFPVLRFHHLLAFMQVELSQWPIK